jgi:hypothetical protein
VPRALQPPRRAHGRRAEPVKITDGEHLVFDVDGAPGATPARDPAAARANELFQA